MARYSSKTSPGLIQTAVPEGHAGIRVPDGYSRAAHCLYTMPTDGSEHSERAIERGVQLAKLCGAMVTGFMSCRIFAY